ncbi:MAG: hypothetical protein K0R10_1506, partial [Alphaproteobacteria bacterium]|nr:hypothetical protein [Alphaproteobacteria bacterium]
MRYALGTLFLVLSVMLLVGLLLMLPNILMVIYSLIEDVPMPEHLVRPKSSLYVPLLTYVAVCLICVGCARMSEKLMSEL